MKTEPLTIKELTEAVGSGITPHMVRHYHTLGLLPQARRSEGNYRLYTQQDVQQLSSITKNGLILTFGEKGCERSGAADEAWVLGCANTGFTKRALEPKNVVVSN